MVTESIAKRRMEQNIRQTTSFLIIIFNIVYTTSGSDCGKEFTGIKGRFSTPNYPYHYPSNTECTWIIKSPVDISDPEIVLKFRQLDVEAQHLCAYDYVEVGYGNISEKNIIGKFCGQIKPRPIKSRSRVIWLRFVSDAEKTYKGFLASWKVKQVLHSKPFPNPGSNAVNECGDSNLFGNEGSIKSPRYPNNYPHHLQCRWVIKAPKQKQIMIKFEYFGLEGASKCRFDYVAVRDGEKENSPVIGIYCGFSKPATITTSTNVASIRFNSDTSISGGGFLIRWNTIDYMEYHSLYYTIQPTTIGPTLAVICGGQLTSRKGTLKSPSYPNFYPDDKTCTWIISVGKPSRIRLTFNKTFDLEREEDCRYDFVSVRDGATADSKEIGKYCGQTHPEAIISSTSSLFVIFKSDKSAAGKGFSADWKVYFPGPTPTPTPTPTTSQKCGGSFSDLTGVITSPGYPSLYPSNQNCIWILSIPNGNQIRLNFEYFDLEVNVNCDYDYLLVRDGAEAHSPIIGRFCGPSTYISEDTLYSSGKDLRIEFHSDISSSKGGFRFSWKGSVQSTNRTPTTQPNQIGGPRLHKVLDSCGGTFEPKIFSGTIFSPGYPKPYKPNLSCTWTIQVPKNNQVSLSFNEFELEESSECTSDYVIVKDGISENSNILGKYCGSKVPIYLTSTKNELSLSFHSNDINIGKGFEISWMRYQPFSNTVPTVTEQEESTCVKQANTLSGKASLSEEEDQCQWNLHAANGNQIQLDFTTFDFSNNNPSCLEDYIEVLNGLTEQAPVMAKFCSTSLPYQITSSGRHLTIRYVKSGKVQTNFELNYKEIGKKKNDQNWFINRGDCGLSTLKENIDLNKKQRRKNVLGEWPWQAALIKKGMSAVTCGGFLIAPQWVMGAAHCFKRSISDSDWIVKLGLVNVRNNGDHAQTFEVTRVHVHPDYNRTTNENDIALIKLHQPATLNKYVNTICLPGENSKKLYEPGNTCHVVGWKTNHPLSSMAIPLVRKSECDNFVDFVVTNNMLCAGYSGIDTCQGDGGGALMCRSNQTFVAIAINSVGKGCGDGEHYGVYTDVRPFLDWIKVELLK